MKAFEAGFKELLGVSPESAQRLLSICLACEDNFSPCTFNLLQSFLLIMFKSAPKVLRQRIKK